MAAMTSKFYYVCVIQYYTDQWFQLNSYGFSVLLPPRKIRLLERPFNKHDNSIKIVTSCQQLVRNLLRQAWKKHCENNLLRTCEQACTTCLQACTTCEQACNNVSPAYSQNNIFQSVGSQTCNRKCRQYIKLTDVYADLHLI